MKINKYLAIAVAHKDMQKPIGIAEYEIPNLIPTELKSSLPSIEEIETELSK